MGNDIAKYRCNNLENDGKKYVRPIFFYVPNTNNEDQ